jgi:type IV pilus assembly protein PilB
MDLHVEDRELYDLVVTQLEIMTEAEFKSAVAMARRLKTTVGKILMDRGIPRGFLLEQLAQAWQVPYIDLNLSDVHSGALFKVDEEFAKSHVLIPFEVQNGRIKIAMSDPRNKGVLDQIRLKTRLKVLPHLAPTPSILRAHLLYKGDLRDMLRRASLDANPGSPRELEAQNGCATELLDTMLDYATATKASDIHVEPYEHETLVRCRIDGVLQEILVLPPHALLSLVSRIKALAGMRIDEKRVPQDGRFEVTVSGLRLDLRVSSLPTHWGEKVVMRVLPQEFLTFDLEALGLTEVDYATVFRNAMKPYGMILVTGPTGTGKSTTLYAMLTRLGTERKHVVNISTVEDPVEYTLPRVNQVSVSPSSGLSFPSALRALLRQDPDVIMVGEIRDRETADIAVRAALVGRLLISTLHTNDATSSIVRMLDVGVEPFLLASTLSLVVSQRLVRRICRNCRESVPANPAALAPLLARPDIQQTIHALQVQNILGAGDDPLSQVRFFRGKGCLLCQGTGFRGRLGVFEVLEIDDCMRHMIMNRADAATIRSAAVKKGMKTLFEDGLAKVFMGETSLEEVTRVAL